VVTNSKKRSPVVLKSYLRIQGEACVYCGEGQECYDHVLAYVWALDPMAKRTHPSAWTVVPSCAECNYLASSQFFGSFKDKYYWIKARLIERYTPAISTSAEWTAEEIAELGPTLRTTVLNLIGRGSKGSRKIAWELPPSVWRLIYKSRSLPAIAKRELVVNFTAESLGL